MRFWEYYQWWVNNYKKGYVAEVTLKKYYADAKQLWNIAPNMKLIDLEDNRLTLQWLLDQYGKTHRRLTVLDWKAHIFASLNSATDDGFISGIAKSQIKVTSVEDNWSIEKRSKERNKIKTMDMSEYRVFKTRVDIDLETTLDKKPVFPNASNFLPNTKGGHTASVQSKMMLISILAHTGCRFAEALGLTANDYNATSITINKTWDYKTNTGFAKTKNEASIRKVAVDKTLIDQLNKFANWKWTYFPDSQGLPLVVEPDCLIFNTTYNDFFRRLQRKYGVKEKLSIHKMRHTYISYLLNENISAEFIAKQVGHTDTSMIQRVYGHLMKERQEADRIKVESLLK